jgi:hypothetical protein
MSLASDSGWEWQPHRDLRIAGARRASPELARIGTRLRVFYDQVTEEAVPDRLMQLLKRLDERRA